MQAAEMAGLMVGKSDRAIREWKPYFLHTMVVSLKANRENMRGQELFGVKDNKVLL